MEDIKESSQTSNPALNVSSSVVNVTQMRAREKNSDAMEQNTVDEEDAPETIESLLEMYESQQLRKLFIGNLSYNTDSEALKEYFLKYGEIEECNVPVDSRTKLSKGFGFVIYRLSKTLDDVMRFRPHKIDGRILEPRRAIRREEADNPAANASTNKMYVGPIGEATDESHIRTYFEPHGQVTEVEIAKKGDHCFVTFDDFDPVDKCVNMKKHMINGIVAIAKKGLTKTAMIEADQRYHQRKRRRQEREEREKRDYYLARHGYNPAKDYWRSGHERAPHRKYPNEFGRGEGSAVQQKAQSSSTTGGSGSAPREPPRDHHRPSRRSPRRRSRSPRRSHHESHHSSRRRSRDRHDDRRDSRRDRDDRRESRRDRNDDIKKESSDRGHRDDRRSDRESRSAPAPPQYPPPGQNAQYPQGYPAMPPGGDPNQMGGYGYPPPKEYMDRLYELYYGQAPPQYPPQYGGQMPGAPAQPGMMYPQQGSSGAPPGLAPKMENMNDSRNSNYQKGQGGQMY